MPHFINEYTDEQGKSPYAEWPASLRDARAKAKVILQIDRMELGLFGDSGPIGGGLSELRIHYGPGYRVYYGRETEDTLLVLCGGNKVTSKNALRGIFRDGNGKMRFSVSFIFN
ncbi:MAG: hypothetical protein OXD47_05490, partial [Gammaproteobacteria bacterium]|nr:hypothetical protein [Gammaproteobacteria bacterium]MCY4338239.1 hypothetical protein [Gammaproteobacteria bacterium]